MCGCRPTGHLLATCGLSDRGCCVFEFACCSCRRLSHRHRRHCLLHHRHRSSQGRCCSFRVFPSPHRPGRRRRWVPPQGESDRTPAPLRIAANGGDSTQIDTTRGGIGSVTNCPRSPTGACQRAAPGAAQCEQSPLPAPDLAPGTRSGRGSRCRSADRDTSVYNPFARSLQSLHEVRRVW
jgi:hypothetical protein